MPRQTTISITYDGKPKEAAAQVAEQQTAAASGTGGTYTVVGGDTLWAIAKKFLGAGKNYPVIYNANKDLIEKTAKAHGKASSDNGHWIWPGEVLTIPGTATAAAAPTGSTAETHAVSDNSLGDKIQAALTALDYTDAATGQSDSITLTLHDVGHEWMGSLMPVKGADVGVTIGMDDTTIDCGKFVLDDITLSGRPTTCVIGGVSIPQNDDFKSLPKTKTFEKTTVQAIAAQIAQAAGVTLVYEAAAVQVEEIEQTDQTDSAFLASLTSKYDLALKVYNHKIVIFDAVTYEEKAAVATFSESDMERWSYKTTVEGTYTGAILKYTDPEKDTPITVTMGAEGRMYSMNTQADNEHDAKLQAAAKVNEANRSVETLDITVPGGSGIIATSNVNITGLGNIDGKYFVDQVRHSISARGYTMELTLHKVQVPIKVVAPTAQAQAEAAASKTYTVVGGDTLWAIAKKFYGSGAKYTVIYSANKDVIESTAKKHGKSSSDNGHWIYPGTTLNIPEA